MGVIKIAILDTGVNANHKEFINTKLNGYALYVNLNGEVEKRNEFHDELGHGTAVFYLINKFSKNAEITNIKIFHGKTANISQADFEKILIYI
ncbi:MAG: hypothetical protein GX288_12575 [Clostridiales bacterium]|nr:hypothetical protein [Clostridiales bacterium]